MTIDISSKCPQGVDSLRHWNFLNLSSLDPTINVLVKGKFWQISALIENSSVAEILLQRPKISIKCYFFNSYTIDLSMRFNLIPII